MAQSKFDIQSLIRSPQDMSNLMAELIGQRDYGGPERRSSKRFSLTVFLDALPLDGELQPCGESFMIATHDVSTTGFGLVGVRPITARYLILTVRPGQSTGSRVLVEVLRCRPHSRFRNSFEIGAKIVTKPRKSWSQNELVAFYEQLIRRRKQLAQEIHQIKTEIARIESQLPEDVRLSLMSQDDV